MIEHADAPVTRDPVTIECEVHLLDPVTLGAGAELGLCTGGAATEQNAFRWLHRAIIARMSALRTYQAGESIEDFCRACKTDRLHTVVAVDADRRPLRVM